MAITNRTGQMLHPMNTPTSKGCHLVVSVGIENFIRKVSLYLTMKLDTFLVIQKICKVF